MRCWIAASRSTASRLTSCKKTSRTSGARGCDLIVISDTSPIRALSHLELLNLLPELFGTVVIPRAVADELLAPRPRFRAVNLQQIPDLRVTNAGNRNDVDALARDLDAGEAEAIALASELHADLLLIDEADGRRIAGQRGLVTTGVLGVLIRARARGLVPTVGPLALRLRDELGFFLTDRVIEDARRMAGEI